MQKESWNIHLTKILICSHTLNVTRFVTLTGEQAEWWLRNRIYVCIYMMQISSMYIGQEEDFNFILFNHFQSKRPLGTGPWWPLYMNGIALMHVRVARGSMVPRYLMLNVCVT